MIVTAASPSTRLLSSFAGAKQMPLDGASRLAASCCCSQRVRAHGRAWPSECAASSACKHPALCSARCRCVERDDAVEETPLERMHSPLCHGMRERLYACKARLIQVCTPANANRSHGAPYIRSPCSRVARAGCDAWPRRSAQTSCARASVIIFCVRSALSNPGASLLRSQVRTRTNPRRGTQTIARRAPLSFSSSRGLARVARFVASASQLGT